MIVSHVQELGYDMNNRIRAIRADRMKNIAIHCGEEKTSGASSYDFYIQLHYLCVNQIKKRGLISHTLDLNAKNVGDVQTLSNCCALMLMSPLEPQIWERIRKSYPNLKTVNMFGGVDGAPTVTPDEMAGGELAGRHVGEKGHTHAAVFLDFSEKGFRQRYAGFIAGVHSVRQDVRIDPINFINTADRTEADKNKEDALDRYFSLNKGGLPTVFFATNSYVAIYLYKYLKEKGLSVPEDVGLVGYDDNAYYQMIDRDISRVYFDIKALSVQAVNLVCATMEKKENQIFTVNLPVEFMDCNSVLPLKKSTAKKPAIRKT